MTKKLASLFNYLFKIKKVVKNLPNLLKNGTIIDIMIGQIEEMKLLELKSHIPGQYIVYAEFFYLKR